MLVFIFQKKYSFVNWTSPKCTNQLNPEVRMPLSYETIAGSRNISLTWSGCCLIKCHFCISICSIKIRHRRATLCDERQDSLIFAFLCRRACFPFSNLMSESVVVIRLSRYLRLIRRVLKCEIFVWNSFSEEFVRRSLSASPLMKPWEMLVLKCFSRFKMCFYVHYRFVSESFTFENVQNLKLNEYERHLIPVTPKLVQCSFSLSFFSWSIGRCTIVWQDWSWQ